MDGTIVDSEPYWMTAEGELARRFGVEWTHEHALLMVGQALPTAAGILQKHGVDLSIREIIDYLSQRVLEQTQVSIPWRPGARELLAATRAAGIPCALVTMSEADFAGAVVRGLPEGTFDAVVTGDRVEHGKPAPDAYLLGLRELSALHDDVTAETALALEDSWPGYQAAVAAGLTTISVPLHAPLPDDPERIEWDTLEGKGVEDLRQAASA